ncbi:CpsD/CapB family tyrosine-protein kinase [Furfurilactobacillus curtus]|uniref:CpsD/CapB family tyrosine-protein kinase n=1 Tax=Furfurilactobacillus curtus TaxID=1746200 RepID=UPI0038B284A4
MSNRLITVSSRSPVAEQLQTLRTNITFSMMNQAANSIMFTSPESGDGRSIIAANMAIAWASQGQRVLLIDADFRHPSMHKIFQKQDYRGLRDALLTRQVNYQRDIQDSDIENLSIMTSGTGIKNDVSLIKTERIPHLLMQFKQVYDLVVIDVPSLMDVSDTQVLASQVDGVVLVIRQGHTTKMSVDRSIELLQMADANLLGYAMNSAGSE